MQRRRQLIAVLLTAVAALIVLLAIGGLLEAPTVGSRRALQAWYERVGPVPVAMAIAWIVACSGALWLVLAAGMQLVADVRPRDGLRRWADVLSPAVLRSMARLSMAAGLAVPTVAAAPRGDRPGVAVMEVLDDEPGTPSTTQSSPTTTTSTPSPVAPTPAVSPPAPSSVAEAVVVEVGDSFWSLAVEAVTELHGRPPADREVVGYWRRLVAANRAGLVDTGNPDLLYPGQKLTLPSP